MLHTLLVIVHVLICVVLSTIVLLQSSKGGGLAGAFGGAGGAPQQMLGSRGMTSLLHKMTIYLAVGFFVTSFLLFMTETTGPTGASNVVGDAAREGELNVPLQEDPLQVPAEIPAEAPAETPAGGTDDEGGDQ
jgi:preprotein translocase subunit SecG